VSSLDPVRGSDIDKPKDNKKKDKKEVKEKYHEPSVSLAQSADVGLLHDNFDNTDIEARKIENIDHFLTVSSDEELSYIAKEYLKKNKSLIIHPDTTAYDFLKAKQKIPTKHVIYQLFPYFALKYVNNDETKLTDSLAQVFRIAKSLHIENISKISFEDIVKLKNSLRSNFKQGQQEDVNDDTEIVTNVDDERASNIIQTDNSNVYLDEIDISYIQETTTGKLSTTEVVDRAKRKLLNKRYDISIKIVPMILAIFIFILPIISIAPIYAAISLAFLIVLPVLYSSIAFGVTRVKIGLANRYIAKNLDRGLEILNSNKELSTDEAKTIKKLREYYAFLFDVTYSSEIRNLYAEMEKLQQEITITDNNSLQTLKDEINKIKNKEKIKIKQQNITEYLQLYERMYFLEMKELEYNSIQFEKTFIPRLNEVFFPLPLEQQQQIIDKVVESKGLKQQINFISLLAVNTDTSEIKDSVSEKQQSKNIIKDNLLNIIYCCKDVAKDRIQSTLEYSSKVLLSHLVMKQDIGNITNIITTPIVSSHGYYMFFFSMLVDSIEDKFSTYRNKKRMLDIKLGKPETTGILFGIINPRLRTKREQIATIIEEQKKTSMQQLKLMKQYNNKIKQHIKKLQKNATISPEELVEMIIGVQQYHLQSVLLANKSTASFLYLMQEKIKELQQEFVITEKN
jgi:hypothetical protein